MCNGVPATDALPCAAGAIKFVLSGANIMCPGLTHKNVVEELAANPVDNNSPVAILAEGKETALAIGHTCVSCPSSSFVVASCCMRHCIGSGKHTHACTTLTLSRHNCRCMSSKEIIETNKGIGVTVVHTLNDGLWKSPNLDI